MPPLATRHCTVIPLSVSPNPLSQRLAEFEAAQNPTSETVPLRDCLPYTAHKCFAHVSPARARTFRILRLCRDDLLPELLRWFNDATARLADRIRQVVGDPQLDARLNVRWMSQTLLCFYTGTSRRDPKIERRLHNATSIKSPAPVRMKDAGSGVGLATGLA